MLLQALLHNVTGPEVPPLTKVSSLEVGAVSVSLRLSVRLNEWQPTVVSTLRLHYTARFSLSVYPYAPSSWYIS